VRSWHHTYNLPVVITHCSNNYGPYQFPEKLIPLIILNALERKPLPIYAKGENIRDWLYVDDHAKAMWRVVTRGQVGETYNIGGNTERTNLEVVTTACDILDKLRPNLEGKSRDLIEFVSDRPGHDLRYAIDSTRIQQELGREPEESLTSGLQKTVKWYVDNDWWWATIRNANDADQRLDTIPANKNKIDWTADKNDQGLIYRNRMLPVLEELSRRFHRLWLFSELSSLAINKQKTRSARFLTTERNAWSHKEKMPTSDSKASLCSLVLGDPPQR